MPAMPRPPRIAALGLATWDDFLVVDRLPTPGDYAIVRAESSAPGGTTSNSAVALARLGAEVALVARVGDDEAGRTLRAALTAAGVDISWVETTPGAATDRATILTGGETPDRILLWHQGTRLAKGDRLAIPAIFDHDVVLLDADDAPLRRFLLDLPAHTLPRTVLLGTLTYLAGAGLPDALDLVLRHDAIVGNERELCSLTAATGLDAAIRQIQARMPGNNLRGGAIARGAAGCAVFTGRECWDVPAFPVAAVDTTGAGDAFAAGVAYGLARRWAWPRIGRFANAVGALATRALGAQASLPTPEEVASLLGEDVATL